MILRGLACLGVILQALSICALEVRVATVQFRSIDGAFYKNLAVATEFIDIAHEREAKIVLLPEFALIGYQLSPDLWSLAELANGRTVQAISKLAQQHGMYIGTSFLEVDGEHFFNTFFLSGPYGKVLGRVKKQVPAGAEGYFFQGESGGHVIQTALGKIGIGICQENYRCFLPSHLYAGGADFVLMPFSYPDLSQSGGLESPKGSYIATWYANQLSIPIVTSNKTGSWPQIEGAYFPGYSTIVNGSGQKLGELDDKPGVLIADISLIADMKSAPDAQCIGPYLMDLTIGSWFEKRVTWAGIWIADLFGMNPDEELHEAYLASPGRRAAARALGGLSKVSNPPN